MNETYSYIVLRSKLVIIYSLYPDNLQKVLQIATLVIKGKDNWRQKQENLRRRQRKSKAKKIGDKCTETRDQRQRKVAQNAKKIDGNLT